MTHPCRTDRRSRLACLVTVVFALVFVPTGWAGQGADETGQSPDETGQASKENGKPAVAAEDSEDQGSASRGLLNDDEIANIAGGIEPDTVLGEGDDFGRRIRDATPRRLNFTFFAFLNLAGFRG